MRERPKNKLNGLQKTMKRQELEAVRNQELEAVLGYTQPPAIEDFEYTNEYMDNLFNN